MAMAKAAVDAAPQKAEQEDDAESNQRFKSGWIRKHDDSFGKDAERMHQRESLMALTTVICV